jgi:cold shock CspA family protein
MKKGTVLFFDPYKGFGKVICSDGISYFIRLESLRDQVQKGDEVEFCIQLFNQKPEAIKVRLIIRPNTTI